MTLIVYPTDDYNTWISLADAELFFESRLYSDAWDAADDDTREIALLQAFRSLNELSLNIVFQSATDRTLSDLYTTTQTADILTALQRAQCEQALHELKNDVEEMAIKDFSLGGLLKVGLPQGERIPRYSEKVLAILRPLLKAPVINRTR